MNKWEELDDIKTPQSWKNEINIKVHKKRKLNRYIFVLVSSLIMILSGTVYAKSDELLIWLYQNYSKDEISQTSIQLNKSSLWIEDDIFFTLSRNETVYDVYCVEKGEFKYLKPKEIKGKYKNQTFSFYYVTHKNKVFGYQYKGIIDDVLSPIVDDNIYVSYSIDDGHDIGILNLRTLELTPLTTDHMSVNPIASSNGNYILINKNDEYWTLYSRKEGTEKIIEEIPGYANSSEVMFVNDKQIQFYNEEGYTISLDINTMETQTFEDTVIENTPLVVEYRDNQTIIRNIYTNQEYTYNRNLENTYNIMAKDYLIFVDDYQYYVYNIEKNAMEEIKLNKEINDLNFAVIEDHQYIIGNEKEAYIIDKK